MKTQGVNGNVGRSSGGAYDQGLLVGGSSFTGDSWGVSKVRINHEEILCHVLRTISRKEFK